MARKINIPKGTLLAGLIAFVILFALRTVDGGSGFVFLDHHFWLAIFLPFSLLALFALARGLYVQYKL
jgi:hypothetical protein